MPSFHHPLNLKIITVVLQHPSLRSTLHHPLIGSCVLIGIAPAPSYPDWSSSVQAYYSVGATPPPFFASTIASPTPHPYIWGGQHPLMLPYGTPVPYPAIYPPREFMPIPISLLLALFRSMLNMKGNPLMEKKGPKTIQGHVRKYCFSSR
ncbi:G-box-binding factor 1 isoform X1 [Cucumis melo var. makuwa]|uniref:G-box-binding factor 1 isoform X1 n=1 Tax=Cucumis melo var. makuwa TaxID=1194695 RepID=A0A5A7UZZ1_CUCMM|nr:G-box-binding factor 1 isoform X1 [Cucumis melo var. makuwa]